MEKSRPRDLVGKKVRKSEYVLYRVECKEAGKVGRA